MMQETQDSLTKTLVGCLLGLPALRPGPDFFSGESPSVVCLDTLFNQQVGVERATAVNLALHNQVARPFKDSTDTVAESSGWPYSDVSLRRSGKTVLNKLKGIAEIFPSFGKQRLGDLPSYTVGALASLERYYRRENRSFDALLSVSLSCRHLGPFVDNKRFREVSADGLLGPTTTRDQIRSAARVLELLQEGSDLSIDDLRKVLLKLSRIGRETADTLLLYVFRRQSLVVDTYLWRISFRHFVIPRQGEREEFLRARLMPHIVTADHARRFHARITEIGVQFCHVEVPDCGNCPLGHLLRWPTSA